MKKNVNKKRTSRKKQGTSGRNRQSKSAIRKEVLKDLADKHDQRLQQKCKTYRLAFWLSFVLVIFSVLFSTWAITSIYSNFQVVTKILDESFERTNLVLDITSSRISACQQEVLECKENLLIAENGPPEVPDGAEVET